LGDIILGDCLEEMIKIRRGTVDLILADLPYGMTACAWDSEIDLRKMWDCFKHLIKDDGAIVLTASQPFTSRLVMSNPEMFKHEWIWEKTRHSNFLAMKYQPAKIHESVLVFGKNPVVYNPIKWYVDEDKIDKRKNVNDPETNKEGYIGDTITRTRKIDDGSRFPKSVLKISNPNNDTLHPTQKPVELFEYLIKTYSNEGDTVLDCCAGSGTTGVACNNTNRNYILIEKEPEFYQVIKERLNLA